MYAKFHDDGGITIKMDGHCPKCGNTPPWDTISRLDHGYHDLFSGPKSLSLFDQCSVEKDRINFG